MTSRGMIGLARVVWANMVLVLIRARGRAAALSLLLGIAGNAAAHEVTPAIADLIVADGAATLSIEMTLEAFVAGVDLEGLLDTNAVANADEYDRLRALGPAAFEAAFRAAWPEIAKNITVETPSGRAALDLVSLDVPPVGDAALPRFSTMTIRAEVDGPVRVGWIGAYGAIIIRQQGLDAEDAYTGFLTGGALTPPIAATGGVPLGAGETFVRYSFAGFDQIIPTGLDHILFVIGLFFLTPRLAAVLWQFAALAAAHAVALAGVALYGVAPSGLAAPASVLDPLLALSVVAVAIANLTAEETVSRWRMLGVFGFGLAHGLSFATALETVGPLETPILPALLGFFVGVEIGRLAVIALAFLAVRFWFRKTDWYQLWIATPASAAIAVVGVYWLVERTVLL